MTNASQGEGGRVESSRDSLRGAGWHCERPGTYLDLTPRYRPNFSWLSPSTLWSSRNDVVAEYVDDPTGGLRSAWVNRLANQNPDVGPDLVVDRHARLDSFKFVFFGDPGEGDASQYALVPLLTVHERDAEFAFISSDVIYPAGGVNEYLEKFCRSYKDFPAPIYAVPGNHDWYDGLHGFAVHFCGADPYREPPRPRGGRGLAGRSGTCYGAIRRRRTRRCWRGAESSGRTRNSGSTSPRRTSSWRPAPWTSSA